MQTYILFKQQQTSVEKKKNMKKEIQTMVTILFYQTHRFIFYSHRCRSTSLTVTVNARPPPHSLAPTSHHHQQLNILHRRPDSITLSLSGRHCFHLRFDAQPPLLPASSLSNCQSASSKKRLCGEREEEQKEKNKERNKRSCVYGCREYHGDWKKDMLAASI